MNANLGTVTCDDGSTVKAVDLVVPEIVAAGGKAVTNYDSVGPRTCASSC